jgi:hypothetical protein
LLIELRSWLSMSVRILEVVVAFVAQLQKTCPRLGSKLLAFKKVVERTVNGRKMIIVYTMVLGEHIAGL